MDLFGDIDSAEPSSSTPSTPTLPTPSKEHVRSPAELKNLGRTVYEAVWNEFYTWEPDYCSDILATIPPPIPATKRHVARVAKADVARLRDVRALQDQGRACTVDGEGDEADTVVVSITYVDAAGGHRGIRQRTTNVTVPIVVEDVDLVPFPPYESCPPIARSVAMDPQFEYTLPFLPYVDRETFSVKAFQAKFKVLEWETPFDPDLEALQVEAVKRLRTIHKISTNDIDRMKIFKQFRQTHNIGLWWEQSQRDALHWPGSFHATKEEELRNDPIHTSHPDDQETEKEELRDDSIHTPHPDDLRQRLMSILRIFCPSINCLHAACETHGVNHASDYIPSRKPQVTGESMMLSEGVPCGPDCFRHIQDMERFMEIVPPSPTGDDHTSSMETLKTILGIAPDLFPCQLAAICLKPCKEVFVQRLQLFPDDEILSFNLSDPSGHPLTDGSEREQDQVQQRKKRKERLIFVDDKPQTCEMLAACAHPGSCTSNNCPCYVAEQHCTLMCRCGVKCVRQWPSCSCTNGRCIDKICSCLVAGRECIPGICNSCDASAGRPCLNTKMQCLASQPIEIKCGSYGWGAFARYAMKKNTFLGSYVGHTISQAYAEFRMELTQSSLNYLFDVTTADDAESQLVTYDAAYLGNSTRFLNHKKKSNVEARIRVVIGEYQLGFFTERDIKKGDELFLDYGEMFWTNKATEDRRLNH